MSKPHVDASLVRFHQRGLLSREGMQRWMQRAARDPADVLPRLEEARLRWLEAVRAAIAALLEETQADSARLLRNLLATARSEDLRFWKHALDAGVLSALGAEASVGRLLAVAAARSDPPAMLDSEELGILAHAGKCTPDALLPIARGSWPISLALIEQMPSAHARGALLQVLRDGFAPRPSTGRPRSQLAQRRLVDAVEALIARKPAVALGLHEYQTLPDQARELLGDGRTVLTAAAISRRDRDAARKARREAEASARLEQETEAVLRAVDDLFASATVDEPDPAASAACWRAVARAMKSIAASDGSAARAGRMHAIDDAFMQRLASGERLWHRLRPAPPSVRSGLAGVRFGSSALFLAFLALPRRRQSELGLQLGSTPRSGSVSIRPPSALRDELVLAAADAYLRSRKGDADLRRSLWTRWGSSAESRVMDGWDRVFTEPRRLHDDESVTVIEWVALREGLAAQRPRLDRFHRNHARWLLRRAARTEFVTAALAKAGEAGAALLLCGTDVRRLGAAWRALCVAPDAKPGPGAGDSRAAQARAQFHQIVRRARALDEEGTPIAEILVREGPAELGLESTVAMLGAALDGTRLGAILRMADPEALGVRKNRRAGIRAAVKLFLTARAQPRSTEGRALRELLRRGAVLDVEAARAVWCAAQGADRENARRLVRRRPGDFARFAIRDWPVDETVGFLASNPAAAGAFADCIDDAQLRAALPALRKRMAKRPAMLAVAELAVLSGLREIALLRVLSREVAERLDQTAGTRLDHRYSTYQVPKRSGGMRTITVPDESLKHLQRLLLVGAFNPVPLHEAAHGFRTGHSILTNARVHVGRRLVVNVDIKGFFPSTLYTNVLAACFNVDGGAISPPAALLLADICCFRGALPTGAPTSPAIGNIVLRRADRAIAAAAGARGISYTRYADDLTFSDEGAAKRIIPFVSKVLGDCGYALDRRKTQLYRSGRQQLVTNLVVNARPNLRRSERRRLRAAVDRRCRGAEVAWHGRPMDDAELMGRLALLAMVDPGQASQHRERLAAQAVGWGSRRA